MRRYAVVAVALLTAFLVLVPVAIAADPSPGAGRVLVSVNGDVALPAGDRADTVVVVDGDAVIDGDVDALVVIDGSAVLNGVHADTIWAVRATVELGPGTVVAGDVMTLDASVSKVGDAAVLGGVTEITPALVAMGTVLAPVAILFWIGFGVATLVAGLALAALGARQVRETERVISGRPVAAFLVGVAGLLVVPTLAVLLMVSIVGAPLGLGILLGAWPLVAYIGYLVAGIWIGDWVLARLQPRRVRERPYLASVVGLIVLQLVGLVPVVGLLAAIASLFGFGGVLMTGWRTVAGRAATPSSMPGGFAAPVGG